MQSVKLIKVSLAATALSLVLFFPTAAAPLSFIVTEYDNTQEWVKNIENETFLKGYISRGKEYLTN